MKFLLTTRPNLRLLLDEEGTKLQFYKKLGFKFAPIKELEGVVAIKKYEVEIEITSLKNLLNLIQDISKIAGVNGGGEAIMHPGTPPEIEISDDYRE